MHFLVEAVQGFFDSATFTDQVAGDSSPQIDSIKNACRDYFLRQYLSENGILPELTRLTAASGNGDDAAKMFIDEHARHVENVNKIVLDIFKKTEKSKDKTDEKLEEMGIQAPGGFGGGGFGGDGGFGDTGGGFGDTGDGLGDPNSPDGGDLGMNDQPPGGDLEDQNLALPSETPENNPEDENNNPEQPQ